MNQKIAWITGASSGIGRSLALAFNSAGYGVIISARRADVLAELATEMKYPEHCKVVPLDLQRHEEASTWAAKALATYGRIDILINNGGMGHLGTALEMPLDVEKRVMDVNFWGAVALTKAVLPHMLERNSGQIWSVASILGFFGSPKLAAYAASKFAMVGYMESLQYELRGTGVHAGLVSPGFVNTQVTLSSIGPDGKAIGTNSTAQENGMLPDVFARKFLKYCERKRPRKHVMIGRYELLAVYLKRWWPALFFLLYGNMTDITRSKSC